MNEKEFLDVLDAVMPIELEGNDGSIEIEPIVAIKLSRNEIVRQSCCVT